MTLPRSVADVIAHHVVWELESIDRMYCNVYVPQLQREGGVVHFFRHHRGYPFASSVLMDPISKAFVGAIHRFVQTQGVPLIRRQFPAVRQGDARRGHRQLNGAVIGRVARSPGRPFPAAFGVW
jgi:hypothetical protein